jgi:hypothetical protein
MEATSTFCTANGRPASVAYAKWLAGWDEWDDPIG